MWAATTPPTGWLICNGQSISRTTYASLFGVLSTLYGSVDANSFSLPDYRGVFLRGLDSGAGIDPARALGTFQDDSLEYHKHIVPWGEAGPGPFGQSDNANHTGSNASDTDNNWWWSNDGSPSDGSPNTAGVLGNETRPKNYSVQYLIRAL